MGSSKCATTMPTRAVRRIDIRHQQAYQLPCFSIEYVVNSLGKGFFFFFFFFSSFFLFLRFPVIVAEDHSKWSRYEKKCHIEAPCK